MNLKEMKNMKKQKKNVKMCELLTLNVTKYKSPSTSLPLKQFGKGLLPFFGNAIQFTK